MGDHSQGVPGTRVAVSLVVCCIAAGCSQTAPDKGKKETGSAPATVAVVHPQKKALRHVVEQPGTVQAYEETQLYARVPGYVGKWHADIGQNVKAGETLAALDVPELEEQTREKQALVRQAEAEVELADKALAAAQATIAVADAGVMEAKASYERWESESKRMAGLVKGGLWMPSRAMKHSTSSGPAKGGWPWLGPPC
jgi:multidrug efflux pump subunit AcrA (membrane-fusion protein)